MIPDMPSDDFIERIRARLGDRYDISRELHGGGMSRVFVAREIALDRQIVIKFLPPEIAAGANRDRFRREIQMAARLSHPHIAPLFSAAEEGELLYYTMPFVSGESLRHSLEAGRVFGISETVEILRDVADALAYAHRAGIVHRDIKPANILREGDHAVVTDFGVAKAVSFALGLDTRASAATVSGMAIGTPAYMAPEQIAGDVAADHRVDIYAFGLLGYELLTGHSPFRAPSPQAQLAAQLTQPPPPILDARPDVPPTLAALLTRCLEKDADRRPPSAESVIEVLRAVSTSSGQVYVAPPVQRSYTRQLLAAAGVLALGAIAWSFASRPTSPVREPAKAVADSAVAKVAAPAPAEITRAERDSLRLLGELNTKRDARLLALLKDSISNAVHKTLSDSLAKANAAELAATRLQDSIARASQAATSVQLNGRIIPFTDATVRGPMGLSKESEQALYKMRDSIMKNARVYMGAPMPPTTMRGSLSPEAFAARANNMGPARRIGVSIYSGLRSPAMISAAGAVRDSVIARLRGKSRYVIIPTDSVSSALARSRITDSLRTWLNADLWLTINVSGDVGADSVNWTLTMRDFTAHGTYANRGVGSRRVALSNSADPATLSALMAGVVQALESMDRAPRREPPLR
ncbi:MAG: putative serine/threonine protein kinase [Gemmatimonadetes bacterium]|nr:putative serine/threonine protein kinase [Gemmatimonadota bacterium]